MLLEVLIFLSLIAKGDLVYCSKYSISLGVYYTSCSPGYCSGSYGYQTCNYYYYYSLYDYTTLSGGAIAGIVIGVLVGVAIVVVFVIVCIKNQYTVRRNVGTINALNTGGANIAVVTTSTGYNQPLQYAPPPQFGYQNPQQTSMAYPPAGPPQYNPQQTSMAYPPVGPQGFGAPTQPYNSAYSYMPQPNM